ncbi:serine hydrolase domain-containing protein [Amorphus orientalis]|uniref:CubicO group peptidase (Beta-lactamase class C family) n=1 Tax=Amorphus orientalis TaxID=649198 RepID=A0AAE3VR84_9HYPH|nr:serine hydrolase [Amorphus orientalis]MDQ0316681.1 CubicO group peptidase (beta-lactamase class C family) [Amorphus orientalis]
MKRYWKWAIAISIAVPVLLLVFLLATGERGLSSGKRSKPRTSFEPRDVATYQVTGPEAERLGWSADRLAAMLDYLSRLSADAFVIVTDGEIVASLGPLDTVYNVHSVRKAMLNAVVGQHVGDAPDELPLDATLEQLGIDDEPDPLTPLQRQATVLHLVRSMSGINHPAAAEGGLTADKDKRLGHDENQPGSVWAYNNWDYNALTTILEEQTGQSVAEAFKSGIADPLGFQDFSEESVSRSVELDLSQHPAAAFRLSARDLARFGQLYLDGGVVDGKAVLPATWIDRISNDYVDTGMPGLRGGHGYLWWIPDAETGLPEGSFFGWGLGQQAVFVVPVWDTVIVHQSDTTEFIKRWLNLQREGVDGDTALEQIVVECLQKGGPAIEFCREHRFTSRREFDGLISLIADARLSD